jgi:hypothetical protein
MLLLPMASASAQDTIGLAAPHTAADGAPTAVVTDAAVSRAAAALLDDLRLIVAIRSQRGWEIDRSELQAALPAALESVCRTAPVARALALRQAQAARQAAGGTVAEAMQRAAGDRSAIEPLIAAERLVSLVSLASQQATQDCPPWLRPHQVFGGRQTVAGRTFLHLDGGGLVTARHSRYGLHYGGGGSGRALVGRGLSPRWAVLSGPEIGGAALLDPTSGDNRLRLHLYGAWPLVLRASLQQWHLDVDAAPVVQLANDLRLRGLGVRIGVMGRLSTGRLLDTLPLAGVGVSVEHMLAGEAGRADEWTVRVGFRVGFDWDWGAAARDRAPWRQRPAAQ